MEPFVPHRILVATDFSDVSTWALRHAVTWAQHSGAQLTVLHVQEPPAVWADPYLGSYNITGLVEATWQAATQRLEEYVRQHVPPSVPVTRELMSGSPSKVIEEYAAAAQADLVVLGTHGRGGISRLILGSVAERALRIARQPTLIVRQPPKAEAADPEGPRLKHILCPVNYTEVARAAFEHAASAARTFEARLTVVFAIEPDGGAPRVTPESVQRAEEMLQAWLPAATEVAFQIHPVVRHGNAAEQIIALAREASVDLVVIGAQHRRFADTTVLGVTTVRVTRHAPCPVLVVPRFGEA
jgi:nucleotide-binding universal stress UspA family protein